MGGVERGGQWDHPGAPWLGHRDGTTQELHGWGREEQRRNDVTLHTQVRTLSPDPTPKRGQRSGPTALPGELWPKRTSPPGKAQRGAGPQARATALPHLCQLLPIQPGARGLARRCSSILEHGLGLLILRLAVREWLINPASRSRL